MAKNHSTNRERSRSARKKWIRGQHRSRMNQVRGTMLLKQRWKFWKENTDELFKKIMEKLR